MQKQLQKLTEKSRICKTHYLYGLLYYLSSSGEGGAGARCNFQQQRRGGPTVLDMKLKMIDV